MVFFAFFFGKQTAKRFLRVVAHTHRGFRSFSPDYDMVSRGPTLPLFLSLYCIHHFPFSAFSQLKSTTSGCVPAANGAKAVFGWSAGRQTQFSPRHTAGRQQVRRPVVPPQ